MFSRFLALAAAWAALSTAAIAQELPITPIDPARLSEHVKTLASDAFEGRGPATAGEQKTVDYLVAQFQAMGLKPGGDGGGWTQTVALRKFEITGPITAAFDVRGSHLPVVQGVQVAIRASQRAISHVALDRAPLVFVGYGVSAPERGWDDFKGVDVRGKVLVVLVNDPDFEVPEGGRFDGKAMTYYGRWTYKYEEAARRGAAGVIVVHETAPAAYGWATVKNSNSVAQFDIVRDDPSQVHPLVEAWMQRNVANALFRRAGVDFTGLKRAAMSPDFRPVTLAHATFSVAFDQKAETLTSRNVVGVVPGGAHADEVLLYTAHWDHLGVGPPDARGDRIYNGAYDNASGVAGLLELARLFAQGPQPQRTVAFIALTAEEKNLLGAAYYVAHPLWPLAKTVGDLNLDGLAVQPARDVAQAGSGKSTLEDGVAAAAAAQGRTLSPDLHPENGSFFRADHFAFAKAGVPAITIGQGVDFYAGGPPAGEAWRVKWIAERYHQPADEWTADMDFRGGALDAGVYYAYGRRLADSRDWPGWKAGSEFKALRDASAGERR